MKTILLLILLVIMPVAIFAQSKYRIALEAPGLAKIERENFICTLDGKDSGLQTKTISWSVYTLQDTSSQNAIRSVGMSRTFMTSNGVYLDCRLDKEEIESILSICAITQSTRIDTPNTDIIMFYITKEGVRFNFSTSEESTECWTVAINDGHKYFFWTKANQLAQALKLLLEKYNMPSIQ